MSGCQWCGGVHGGYCPLVKAYELYENGTLKRVEFITPMDVPPEPKPEEPAPEYPKLPTKE